MKVSYRGHEISVWRERCMAGYELLYYSIFRESDQYECTSGFTTGSETVREYVKYMRERVDSELADPNPWGESEEDPLCEHCDGTGRITVRTSFPMSYVCAGEPPEYASGVIGAPCDRCRTP